MQETRLIAIGGSAGGVEVICDILAELNASFQTPILIVIHVPAGPGSQLYRLLSVKSRLPVIEVDDKEPIKNGNVYLAPPDYHLLVDDPKTLTLSNDVPVNYSRPSIDVLFESAADVFGNRSIGVILTGANRDGADGLSHIIACGGIGIVQNPSEAYCPAMPNAAISVSPAALIMSKSQITSFLNERA
jgi:two-component system chemotaxis response regulator CheB